MVAKGHQASLALEKLTCSFWLTSSSHTPTSVCGSHVWIRTTQNKSLIYETL